MTRKSDDRVTTRLGAELFEMFERWRSGHPEFSTRSDALRAIVARAIAAPVDAAWLAAYGQIVGELRQVSLRTASRIISEEIEAKIASGRLKR